MRCSHHVAAPLLASTALGLLAGCDGPKSTCVNNDTHQVVDASFCRDSTGSAVTTHTYHLEGASTRRGGFGENFAAVLLGSAAAAGIIRAGG